MMVSNMMQHFSPNTLNTQSRCMRSCSRETTHNHHEQNTAGIILICNANYTSQQWMSFLAATTPVQQHLLVHLAHMCMLGISLLVSSLKLDPQYRPTTMHVCMHKQCSSWDPHRHHAAPIHHTLPTLLQVPPRLQPCSPIDSPTTPPVSSLTPCPQPTPLPGSRTWCLSKSSLTTPSLRVPSRSLSISCWQASTLLRSPTPTRARSWPMGKKSPPSRNPGSMMLPAMGRPAAGGT
jgi:hypothetical protein